MLLRIADLVGCRVGLGPYQPAKDRQKASGARDDATLGLQAELAKLIEIDGQLPDGFYKRAWETINRDKDDYLGYVEELRGAER